MTSDNMASDNMASDNMASENNRTEDSRGQPRRDSAVLEKDLLQYLGEYNLDEAEVRTLAEIDALLRQNFEDLDSGLQPVDEDRLSGILDELETAPELAVLKRTRRSIRLILWLTISLVSLLGAYGLIALVMKIGGF